MKKEIALKESANILRRAGLRIANEDLVEGMRISATTQDDHIHFFTVNDIEWNIEGSSGDDEFVNKVILRLGSDCRVITPIHQDEFEAMNISNRDSENPTIPRLFRDDESFIIISWTLMT